MPAWTRYWILVGASGPGTGFVITKGEDLYRFHVAPDTTIKKGDIAYVWEWQSVAGRGEVAETPQEFLQTIQPGTNYEKTLRRKSILLSGYIGFSPRVSRAMMYGNKNLRDLVPGQVDDACALEISKVRANYIDEFITQYGLDRPPQAESPVQIVVPRNISDITIQALLTFGDKTTEGQLVEGVRIPWFEILKIISRNPNEIYTIDPRRFEEIIAGAWERAGYIVELTPRSGDKGRDIIATRRDSAGSIRIFDQIKRYKISRPVTAEEVRALVGVLTIDGNVSKGLITTTSTFAPTLLDDPDIKRLVPNRLELRPREVLLPWLDDVSSNKIIIP
jgi:restriction system protein